MWKLVQTINNALLENKLQEKVLKASLKHIGSNFQKNIKKYLNNLSQKNMLKEK